MRMALAVGAPGLGVTARAGGPDAAARARAGPPTFAVAGGRLRVEVCADDIVRVAFAKDDAFFARPSLMAAPKRCTASAWKLTKTDKTATIATAKLRVDVDLGTGAVSFRDAAGRPIARRARRGTVAGAGHRHGRSDASRAPAVGAERRRAPLRPGPAPAGAARHQGHRPGAAPVQRRDLHPAAGVEPRLRDPVGQHVADALRPGPSPPAWEEISGDGERRRRLDADAHRDRSTYGSTTAAAVDVIRPATSRSTRVDSRRHRALAAGLAARRGRRARSPAAPARASAAPPLEGGHRRQDRALRRQAAAPPTRRRRSGRRSATASTTPSSTARRWIASSPATGASPARRR